MYFFIDESKQIKGKNGQIVLGWLLTTYRPSTIDKIYSSYLKHIWIQEKDNEIKSCDWKYKHIIKHFYTYLQEKWFMKNIELVWLYAKNYYEKWERYYELLVNLIIYSLKNNILQEKSFTKMNILSDVLKLDYTQEKIRNLLNQESELSRMKRDYAIQNYTFHFENSKRYGWIKFSDFVAWILRKKYISQEEDFPEWFQECLIWNDIVFITIKK